MVDGAFLPSHTQRRLEPDDDAWLVEIASPVLDELSQRLQWPSVLAVPRLDYMETLETNSSRTYFDALPPRPRGFRVNMLGSASGRAYLAFCSRQEFDAVISRLRHKDVPAHGLAFDDEALRRLVESTRQRGYGVRAPTSAATTPARAPRWTTGGASIAMPVRLDDRVVATINLTWRRQVMSTDRHGAAPPRRPARRRRGGGGARPGGGPRRASDLRRFPARPRAGTPRPWHRRSSSTWTRSCSAATRRRSSCTAGSGRPRAGSCSCCSRRRCSSPASLIPQLRPAGGPGHDPDRGGRPVGSDVEAVAAAYGEALSRKPEAAVADAIACVREHQRAAATWSSSPRAARRRSRAGSWPRSGSATSTWSGPPARCGRRGCARAMGESKVALLVERGYPPPWSAAYSDSPSDLPLFAGTPRPVLVNADEKAARAGRADPGPPSRDPHLAVTPRGR